MRGNNDYMVDATPEQLAAVRERCEQARAAMVASCGEDTWLLFPKFKAALDALPDMEPCLGLAPEIRAPLLWMLDRAGVTLPDGMRAEVEGMR